MGAALFLYNNDTLLASGILSRAYTPKILPIIYLDLERNATSHWNPTVASLAGNVLKHYEDTDPVLFRKCAEEAMRAAEEKQRVREERDRKWEELEALVEAAKKAAGIADTVDETAAGAARAMAAAMAADASSEPPAAAD